MDKELCENVDFNKHIQGERKEGMDYTHTSDD